MNLTHTLPITVLLDKNAHRYARQFAEQVTPQKGKQVYLNTLAVYAVHQYLQWLSIPTNLSESDCWHPGLRAIFNIADLFLPAIGKLECRPILPDEETLIILPESAGDRMGYLAIRVTEELDRVQLLGFISTSNLNRHSEAIPITQLQSLDSLIETIHRQKFLINLRQWLSGIFEPEWQPIEELLASQGRQFRMTSNNLVSTAKVVSRGKVITLENERDRLSFLLVVKMSDKSTEEIDICLQLYPYDERDRLPAELEFAVLDESGHSCLEAKTKDNDNWIQLEFTCHQEEKFIVKIILENKSISEQFVV